MLSYSNLFECGTNILDRLDVTYERACMATPKDKYYTKLLKNIVDENNCNDAPLSNGNIQQSVRIVMEETEAELERNINEITIDTSFKSICLSDSLYPESLIVDTSFFCTGD